MHSYLEVSTMTKRAVQSRFWIKQYFIWFDLSLKYSILKAGTLYFPK